LADGVAGDQRFATTQARRRDEPDLIFKRSPVFKL